MEFDHFINEKVLKRREEFDILAWWKSNGLKYPASTSNDVAQIKCRLSGALSSFDLFVNNSSSTSKKHGSVRMEFDHFIGEGVL